MNTPDVFSIGGASRGLIPAAPAVETRLIFTPTGGIICYTFTVVAEVIQPLLAPPLHIFGCSLFAIVFRLVSLDGAQGVGLLLRP